jgi:hypothetical protein
MAFDVSTADRLLRDHLVAADVDPSRGGLPDNAVATVRIHV